MKAKKHLLVPPILVAGALVWCTSTLHAQNSPTISSQPVSQTNLVGSNVIFSVVAMGTGPFNYQWKFNGTNLPNGIITTVAGNGSPNYGGDGGAATNAGTYSPMGLVLDATDNMYISDQGDGRVRKVNTNGIISTVAGNGAAGFAGDGGAATNASFYTLAFVVKDPLGNLYVSDYLVNRVRKVDASGIITTIAGNGNSAYAGDGGPATNASLYNPQGLALDTAGNLYVADYGEHRVRKVDTNGIITTVAGTGANAYGGDGGAATNASLSYPWGVAFDASGNLYIADTGNTRVRKVDTNGIITTVAGNGNYSYSGDGGTATNAAIYWPVSICLDTMGNIYIGDNGNNRIRKVATNGVITTVAGNGSQDYGGDGSSGNNASLSSPRGIALDAGGNLFIADSGNNRVREVRFVGEPKLFLNGITTNDAGNYSVVITSSFGSITSAVATLTSVLPPSILVQPSSQWVVNGSNAVLNVTATGTQPLYYSWYFNSTNLIQTSTNSLLLVTNINPSTAGQYSVVVTNTYASATSEIAILQIYQPPLLTTQTVSQTNFVGSNVTFTVAVSGFGPFTYQWQFNGSNLPNNIITTVAGNGTVTSGGVYNGDGGSAISASVSSPSGLFVDVAGNIFISDPVNNRIREVNTSGDIFTWAGLGNGSLGDGGAAADAKLWNPSHITADSLGNFFIADTYNERIRIIYANGSINTVAGGGGYFDCGDGGPATNACIHYPMAVVPDSFGNLYIADQLNNGIRRVDTNGIITTMAGYANALPGFSGDGGTASGAGLYHPTGVALDLTGNLYIADYANYRVRKIGTNGIISTIAGNGSGTYAGDGGKATNASINYPADVALDYTGNLYIADQSSHRIRKVDAGGNISTVAGNGNATYAGDGGAATNASLYNPFALSFDGAGNLFIADQGNNRIREVGLAGFPTRSLANIGTNNNGNYAVIISNPYGSVTSAVATLTAVLRPSIIVQPISQMVIAGSNATMSVAATGTPPLFYSWIFNSTNYLQSGTNTSLAVSNFNSGNVGKYTVIVTNAYASATSQIATLSFPLLVTTIAGSQTGFFGSNVIISVAVSGSGPFTYQWQFNGTNLPNNIIRTVAGNAAITNYAGDGGVATNAHLNNPRGVALDNSGNMYIADTINQRIRKVATNGIITTVAGNGGTNYGGDGSTATSAILNNPQDVALDSAGNFYIADSSNHRIRKVNTNGIITTVAGNGTAAYAGDGGAATNASLKSPGGVALDILGNLYVADTSNERIRIVDSNGIITTIAGRTGAGFSGDGGAATNANLSSPFRLVLDNAGNLYIADQSNNRIRKVDTNGIITTVAGNGNTTFVGDGSAATNAGLSFPRGVTLDSVGNLFIVDSVNNRIRKVNSSGIITTVAGNGVAGNSGDGGTATNANLNRPYGVTSDVSGNLFIADASNQRIRQLFLYAGYPTFTLGSVSAKNAGDYRVVVTCPYGSATSVVATLTVTFPPPQIIDSDIKFGFLTNRFGFNFSGTVGQTNVIDGSTNLMTWIPLITNISSGNPTYFFDSISTNFPQRFYRVRSP